MKGESNPNEKVAVKNGVDRGRCRPVVLANI